MTTQPDPHIVLIEVLPDGQERALVSRRTQAEKPLRAEADRQEKGRS